MDNKFLYSKPKPVKEFRPIISHAKNDVWALDLADYSRENGSNKGYILVVVDVYTRYMWARVLTNKDKASISAGLNSIIEEAGAKPKSIQSDRESALIFNEHFKDIAIYHVDNLASNGGSPIAERAIRTIKERIEMLREDTPGRGWKQYVNAVVKGYNESKHRTIKMKPNEAIDEKHSEQIKEAQKRIRNRKAKDTVPKIDEDEEVITTRQKANIFEKGYKKKWNEEVLTIVKIHSDGKNPPVYELSNGKKYYQNQIKKVTYKQKQYLDKKIKHKDEDDTIFINEV